MAHRKMPQPPRLADRFLEWFLPEHLLEDMQGDLHEIFYKQVDTLGEVRARKDYFFAAIRYIRPYFFKRRKKLTYHTKPLHTDMIRNYLTIAFRNLYRQKAFAFITVFGLATGMAFSILIMLWVQNEWSYDRFHSKASQIYRITVEVSDIKAAITPPPMAPALVAEMPEVANAVRLKPAQNLVEVGSEKFEEKDGYYADAAFFDLFSFPLLAGNAKTALTRIDGIVLSEKLAKKYFGADEALGKTVRIDNQHTFVVTGIVRVPDNTHMKPNYLLPVSLAEKDGEDLTLWGNLGFYSYIKLQESVSARPEVIRQITGKMNALFAENESEAEASFHLQPLTDIYLHSDLLGDVPWLGSIGYVRIFSVAAICILIVACINFMNLSTARSASRAKEVGLRKVIGARRSQLMEQFLSESLLVTFLALILALGMIKLLLPLFNTITDKALSLNLLRVESLAALLGIALLTGLLSGSYPALFLSAFRPVGVLKGITKTGRWNLIFRNGLVMAQFTVSVVLIAGTVTVYRQLELIRNKHLGFDKENLLYVPIRGELGKHSQALHAQLAQNPLTRQFSVISELPVNSTDGSDVQWEGKNPQQQVVFFSLQVDQYFLETFGVELLTGRGFSAEFKGDTANYLVNQAALKLMGMDAETAIGKWFDLRHKGKIIGVIKDFNFRPLHQRVEPLVIELNTSGLGNLVVRAQPQATEATIATLENTFRKLNPAYPFSYGFVDER
jgi:ABC-type lipoprotein release transport system permease subunit